MEANTTGYYHTALGYSAMEAGGGVGSVGLGYKSLEAGGGNYNCCVGYQAGNALTTGTYNTIIGGAPTTGSFITGNRCVFIGTFGSPSASDQEGEFILNTGNRSVTGKGAGTGFISVNDGVGNQGNIYQGNNTSTWATTSDIRIKKNVVDNNTGLDKINQIQVKNFEYRTEDEVTELPSTCAIAKEGLQLGVIAQEIEEILPDLVNTESTGCKNVNPDNLTWYLVNAVKELSAEVEKLKNGS